MGGEEAERKAATERMQENIRRLVTDVEARSAAAVLRDDPELTRQLLEALPTFWKAHLKMVQALSGYVAGLAPEERAELTRGRPLELDAGALASTADEFSELVMEIHRDNPGLASEVFPEIEAALSQTDLGKARQSVTALLDYWTTVTANVIEDALENPAMIANIVGMVPPLVNSLIRVLSTTLENIDLPPETLALAFFNLLTALDAEGLGRLLSLIAKRGTELHVGDRELGGDQPRVRAVTRDLFERVRANLDVQAFANMLLSLGDEIEVVAAVIVEAVSGDPELIDTLTRVLVGLTNDLAHILSNALDEMSRWPDGVLSRMGEEAKLLDMAELGRVVDSFASYALRLREANPGLHRELYGSAIEALDVERVGKNVRAFAGDLAAAAAAHPGFKRGLEPEAVGRRLNAALAAFNDSVRPGVVKEYLSRMLAEIEPREIEVALRTVSGGAIDAVFTSTDTAMSVLKTAATNAWKVLRHLFELLVRQIR